MWYKKNTFKIVIISSVLGWLLLCQCIFYAIQTHYAEKITVSLANQFRSEFYSDNYQKLSNMVADITRSNYIRCSKLTRLDLQRVIIDFTSIQDECDSLHSFLTLNHVNKDLIIKSLSGTEYSLSFQITNTNYFLIALWLMRFIGLVIIAMTSLIFSVNEKRKKLELNRLQEIANAKELISLKLAHDIRSPLSVLNLISSRLQSPEQEVNDLFNQAINRITDIASDLLSPTSKELITDVNYAVTKIVSEKEVLYKRESIDFKLELDSSKILCAIDSSELERITSNLINNAAEALEGMPQERKIITVSTMRSNQFCVLKIKDKGRGIPDSILKALGKERLSHGKENHQTSGSGIGLFSANEYLKQHNGKLEINSILNEFTEISLSLPIIVS